MIGNREKIHIYKDNWIPRPETFKPLCIQNLPAEATISELINIKNQWGQGKVKQWFIEDDANDILRILLPRRPGMDEIIWHFDKKKVIFRQEWISTSLKNQES